MPKICYRDPDIGFRPKSLALIEKANEICAEYAAAGFDLTLRQLYYQFVSRDIIPNTFRDYKNLGTVIGNARLAGLMDWDYINDRTRNLRVRSRWDNPRQIQRAVAQQYHK